jgi:hypothetical protein
MIRDCEVSAIASNFYGLHRAARHDWERFSTLARQVRLEQVLNFRRIPSEQERRSHCLGANAQRRSASFVSQRHHWINLRRPPSWNIARQQGHYCEH